MNLVLEAPAPLETPTIEKKVHCANERGKGSAGASPSHANRLASNGFGRARFPPSQGDQNDVHWKRRPTGLTYPGNSAPASLKIRVRGHFAAQILA
jgi:hypothetical protein